MSDGLPIKARHYFSAGLDRVRDAFRLAYLFGCDVAAAQPVEIIVRPVRSRRTLLQNAKMWAMLADIASQVQWAVNGVLVTLDADDWKAIFSAGMGREVRMAAGIDGGFVMLGASTRRMTVAEMGDLIEVMYAFGAERGVVWSDAGDTPPTQWEARS